MTATAGILRHHDLDHPPQSTRPTSSSNAIPDYDPTSQNFEEVTQNDETNEIQNLYHEQHSMLNLLLKEVQDIKNVDSSLSERPLSKFLASEDGMKAAGFIATTSTADLKAEFLNLCHLVKSKEEERERVLAEVEMLRVELGMTYRTQPTPSMQFDVSAKPQTDMQKRLEERRNELYHRQSGKQMHSESSELQNDYDINSVATDSTAAFLSTGSEGNNSNNNSSNNNNNNCNTPPDNCDNDNDNATPPSPPSTSPETSANRIPGKAAKRPTEHWRSLKNNLPANKKMNISQAANEFKTREQWAHITGNSKAPEGLEQFGCDHERGADGVRWMLQKPDAWQKNPSNFEDRSNQSNLKSENSSMFYRSASSMANETKSMADKRRISRGNMPISDFLGSIPTFQNLTQETFQKLEQACQLQIFETGKPILEEDSFSQYVFVIREGGVKVLKKNNDRVSENIMRLTQGDYFGEGELDIF